MHLRLLVLLSKWIANAASKYLIYTACSQRARGGGTHNIARCLTRCTNAKLRRCLCACLKWSPPPGVLGVGTARTQRVHNVAGDYTTRISAICNCFERCGNAVRPPLWRDRGLTQSNDKRKMLIKTTLCNQRLKCEIRSASGMHEMVFMET